MMTPATIPLTISSLEIAGLAGKKHKNVLADIRKMLADLGLNWADFSAQYTDATGRSLVAAQLPKRETLILVTGYSVSMRARIIDRWQELELAVAGARALPTELDQDARRAIGGIVKGIVHKELVEIIPGLVRGTIASENFFVRSGRTAGTIWRDARLPRLKGAAVWFGNRLAEMGCQIENAGRADIGGKAVRLFDPDKAALCLKNGLLLTAERYAQERRGQGKLTLVGGGRT